MCARSSPLHATCSHPPIPLPPPPAVAIGLDAENFPSGPQYPPTVLVHFPKDGGLAEVRGPSGGCVCRLPARLLVLLPLPVHILCHCTSPLPLFLPQKVRYMLGEMQRLGRAGVEVAVGEAAVTPPFFSERAPMIR